MPAIAALQLALALLPSIQTGVTEFIAWIESLKASLKQTGEWTDALDQQYRTVLFAKTQDPAYQPDPK